MNNLTKWIIVLMAGLIIGGAVVYAATVLTIPATVNVVSASELTVNLNPIPFGNLIQGQTTDVTVRITNTGGSTSGIITATAEGLPTGVTFTTDIPTGLTLTSLDYYDATFTLEATESATLGTDNFNILIDEAET